MALRRIVMKSYVMLHETACMLHTVNPLNFFINLELKEFYIFAFSNLNRHERELALKNVKEFNFESA